MSRLSSVSMGSYNNLPPVAGNFVFLGMLQTFSILVTGKVQGVNYRQSTKAKALELGLTGIVKNQPDGSVFIQASGATEQLNKLVAWCKRGPALAKVASVQVEHIEPRAFLSFTIER